LGVAGLEFVVGFALFVGVVGYVAEQAAKLMAASQGLEYQTATGTATMTNRHVVKDMYLAECKGTTFDIIKTFKAVAHGQTCS
ncbi:MAG: hypothetical protein RLT05_36685, partial [Bauldia litoralis]